MCPAGKGNDNAGAGAAEHKDLLAAKRAEYGSLLREAVQRAVSVLAAMEEVERVSLVGSFARGCADLRSDLDLLVVMRTEKPFIERLRVLYPLLSLPVDVDILCYTPEEFVEMKERPSLKNMLKEEVVLYEKKPS